MKALPTKLRILGHVYEVRLKEGLLRDWNKWGDINTRSQVIQIEKSATYSQQMNSLIHEVLEAIDELLGLGMDHKILQAVAAAFFSVLSDNPTGFG